MQFATRKNAILICTACLFAVTLGAAEEPKDTQPATTPGTSAGTTSPAVTAPVREPYNNAEAGYSLTLPTGYRKLDENETREVFKEMGELLNKGKEIGEGVRKRPPIYFTGPVNPKQPKEPPPSLAIFFTERSEHFDPAQLQAYKELIEEKQKREGEKVGDIELSIIQVDGIASLQVEEDLISPINNARERLIRVAIPGKDKCFELIFNFSTDQKDDVRAAVKETLDSFKVMEHPPVNIENRNKWLRVLYYTVGFGLAGVLLSLILRKWSGEK